MGLTRQNPLSRDPRLLNCLPVCAVSGCPLPVVSGDWWHCGYHRAEFALNGAWRSWG